MRRRFFVEKFEVESAELRGDSAEHLGRVLRAQAGQLYELSDGTNVWLARVANVALGKSGHSRIQFDLVEPIPSREPKLHLALLLSIVKFDRFEWCLEKATELGAAEITPVIAARTDQPLVRAAAKRAARWEKILIESAQQSRRLRPPVLNAAIHGSDAFGQSRAALKILLSEGGDVRPIRDVLRDVSKTSIVLAIGPEGGWTDEEFSMARKAGFAEASLGETILRTETAVIAALAILQFALGGTAEIEA